MSGRNDKFDNHIRHLAHQIIVQMPEETGEALLVLEYAKRLLLLPLEQTEARAALKLVEKDG